ncbi:NFX1-type zinc finger-containing protein 1-like [Myzus persicae]|nr:NFX1-type zinc finger-containing protein 1-like [Myzus persicae]
MNQNDEEICLKQCPLCKTPILKTQRFLNQVKVILKDISKIKTKQYGELAVIRSKTKTVIESLKSLDKNFISNYIGDKHCNIKHSWNTFCKPLFGFLNNKRSKFTLPANDIESLNFVIDLFINTSKFKNRIKEIKDGQRKQTIINHFDWILSVAFTYAQQLSNQQKSDIRMEMIRGSRILNLFEIMSNGKFQAAVTMQTLDTNEIKKTVDNMEALLMSCSIYTLSRDQDINKLTEEIQQKIDDLPLITDDERQMIHAAMSTSFSGGIKAQGHWCKCPNGHIYCVTECGGPMQQSICPECKVEIGGQSHRHVSGITVASEMDGARNLMFQY